MAQTKIFDCPDCGRTVSRKAVACPGCGRQISFAMPIFTAVLWALVVFVFASALVSALVYAAIQLISMSSGAR